MEKPKIYIICTFNKTGRYVITSTTDAARAEELAAHTAENYGGGGWVCNQIQEIPAEQVEKDGPGVPSIIRVYHLRGQEPGGNWCNVELYRVVEE